MTKPLRTAAPTAHTPEQKTDFPGTNRKGGNIIAIAGFALFVIGVIFIIVSPINKKKNARCSMQTKGILMKILEREDSDGPLPSMCVYSYYVDGIEYQLKSTAYNPQVDKVGDHCTIWYNPAKPKDAQSFHYDSDKVYKIILIIGIVMVLLGIFLIGFGFVQSIL